MISSYAVIATDVHGNTRWCVRPQTSHPIHAVTNADMAWEIYNIAKGTSWQHDIASISIYADGKDGRMHLIDREDQPWRK